MKFLNNFAFAIYFFLKNTANYSTDNILAFNFHLLQTNYHRQYLFQFLNFDKQLLVFLPDHYSNVHDIYYE
jgi:hypothetical protein